MSVSQGTKQYRDFLFDVGRVVHGAGDFVPNEVAEAPASRSRRCARRRETPSSAAIRAYGARSATPRGRLQGGELRRLPALAISASIRSITRSKRVSAHFFSNKRRQSVGAQARSHSGPQRSSRRSGGQPPAPSFPGAPHDFADSRGSGCRRPSRTSGTVPYPDQRLRDRASRQTRQKPLDHVLGCLCIVALAAHERVEGIPVIAAKGGEPPASAPSLSRRPGSGSAGSLEALDGGQVPGVSGFGIHAHNDNGYALFARGDS